ncbi:hypothetical protein N7486_005526 [Penicillium sp. IBT 16267x]|nr:hypothetical protein N7486_005526 [Penicillium sp. IBT 16267x]
MNGTMKRCASPVFESNSSTDVDLELMHSNESESQQSSLFGSRSPSTVSDNDIGHVDGIDVDNGLDLSIDIPLDFDPLEGFKLTAAELQGTHGAFDQMTSAPDIFTKRHTCNKRTIDLTFAEGGQQGSEALLASKKRALYVKHAPSTVVEAPAIIKPSASVSSLVMPTVSGAGQTPAILNSSPPISSHTMSTVPGVARTPATMKPSPPISSYAMPAVSSSTPASISSMDKFEIGPSHMVQHLTNEVTSRYPPKADTLSPYQPVGYNPSTPSMHPNVVHLSNETLNYRLTQARQRAAAVTVDRNKLQKGLLQYTQIDPITGLLGIDKMKTEMATMRRLLTRAKNKEATEIEIWRTSFAMLADEYSKLAQQHDNLRRRYEPSGPFNATPTYPPALHQQAAHTDPPVLHQPESTNLPTSRYPTTSNSPPTSYHPVVDLTTDTEPVSAQGTRSPGTHSQGNNSSQANKSLPKNNSLTDFHHQFRNKKMDWLHNSETTSAAKARVFEEMNSPIEGRLAKVSFAECSHIVEANNGVRLALGGQFKKTVTSEEVYEPSDEDLARMMEDELLR